MKTGAFRVGRDGSVGSLRIKPGGLALLVVGKRARRAQDGASPVPVRLTQGRDRRRGTLELTFDGTRRALGELRLPGCRLRFEARR